MTTPNGTFQKISSLVSKQVPQFVRDDNPTFVAFLEAYYEFLEQYEPVIDKGQPIERAKNMLDYLDVDKTIDAFSQHFYKEFLALIPTNIQADKTKLLKHVQQFYRARGTEKSYRLLFRILFGEEIDFYYPASDILKVSDGKWFIQKSLRINNVVIDGVVDDSLIALNKLVGFVITGNTSLATAAVENVIIDYEGGAKVNEIFLSQINGNFENGETITVAYTDVITNVPHVFTAQILSGILSSIHLIYGGHNYKVGDIVGIESNTGGGAIASVAAVSSGGLLDIIPTDDGAGFLANDELLFVGGGGSGANGYIQTVSANNFYHPNTYQISVDIILPYANVVLNSASYGFPAMPSNANANTVLANAFTTFTYGPTGPVLKTKLNDGGSGFSGIPSISVISNTIVHGIGILGKMTIASNGANYLVGDKLVFHNVFGGYGTGAAANVTAVDGAGGIVSVYWIPVSGFPVGGIGWDQNHLPTITINSVSGTGGKIVVDAILGDGAKFTANTDSVGTILTIRIDKAGQGFLPNDPPHINLKASGDGTALANASVSAGVFTYPGRFLDQSGFLSSAKFLENFDYYQTYSYVIRAQESFDSYTKIVKNLLHPAGLKMWGQYRFQDNIDVRTNVVLDKETTVLNSIITEDNIIRVTEAGSVRTVE